MVGIHGDFTKYSGTGRVFEAPVLPSATDVTAAPPRPARARHPRGTLVIAVTALLLLVGSSGPSSSSIFFLLLFLSSASGFDGAALPAIVAHDFTLTDQYGHLVSLSDYRGQVVVLAFLYSTCGPTCIVIAQQIRGALDELASTPSPFCS